MAQNKEPPLIREEAIAFFKGKGDVGVTSRELEQALDVSRQNLNNAMSSLRKKHAIVFDKDKKLWFYKSEAERISAERSNAPNIQKDDILTLLRQAGKNGISIDEIINKMIEKTGHRYPNTRIHGTIHTIRTSDDVVVKRKNGRYIVSDKEHKIERPIENAEVVRHEIDPLKHNIAILSQQLNDKRIIEGFQYISKEKLPKFLDVLKEAIFYKNVAINIIETEKLMHEIGKFLL